MYFVIIGMSILYVIIGYVLTEKNAKYLLAGYNTMSEKERARFDLKAFLPFFRKFHLYFGFSHLILGMIIYLISEKAVGIFMGSYPVVAYLYFVWASNNQFSKDQESSEK